MLKIVTIFLCILAPLALSSKVQLRDSELEILVKTPSETSNTHKTSLLAPQPSLLKATQSSKIYVYTQLKFSKTIQPQFVSGRLVHSSLTNVSSPVLGSLNKGTGKYEIVFDIGNPLTIQPVSGQYEIELLIADDKLTDPFRKKVASLEITFSKSLDKPRLSDLHYEPKQEIIFKLGQDRVDPPSSFTAFVVLLIVLSFVGFVYSLTNLKMNLRLFPREGLGSLLNIVFLVMMGAIVWVLIKFWASWTFLETVRVLGMMVIPTVIVGNYAILSIPK